MLTLIPELIARATDPTIEITTLLRKAVVAARLLKLPEAASWFEHELQGYPDGCPVPSYRRRRGILKLRQPNSPFPLPVADSELALQWQTRLLPQPVSELVALAAAQNPLRIRYSPENMTLLKAELRTRFEVELWFPPVLLREVIEELQGQVLNWAVELVEAESSGDRMNNMPQEQQAQQVTIHIGGNFTGGQLMVSSPGGQQQQTVTGDQKVEALAELLPWLEQVISQGSLKREICDELQADLNTLKAQAASPKPKWPVIGAVADSVRSILEGAGGGVLAGQALVWLATLTTG